jgi:hypothetical protein
MPDPDAPDWRWIHYSDYVWYRTLNLGSRFGRFRLSGSHRTTGFFERPAYPEKPAPSLRNPGVLLGLHPDARGR